jgi:uncharacterized damage-inducible protein DinB
LPAGLRQALAESYLRSERMNQVVLEHLDPAAWSAKPPYGGAGEGWPRGRGIATIFSHVHNVRRKWVRLSAPHLRLPPPLDRTRSTPTQAAAALAESAACCGEMLMDARVEWFRRDALAKPWPVGSDMVAYMIAHDAHHRGQVCMLAHQLGYPLPGTVVSAMWAWERGAGRSVTPIRDGNARAPQGAPRRGC